VSDLCQTIADLAHLGDLVRRKNNNLRAINGGRGTESIPGYQVFTRASFKWIRIPGYEPGDLEVQILSPVPFSARRPMERAQPSEG
jgi:hypothetical protein